MLQHYRDWRDAKALVEELEQAVRGIDRNYSPPKVSPLFDADGQTWQAEVEARNRAKARLEVARNLEKAMREFLLASLDAHAKAEQPK